MPTNWIKDINRRGSNQKTKIDKVLTQDARAAAGQLQADPAARLAGRGAAASAAVGARARRGRALHVTGLAGRAGGTSAAGGRARGRRPASCAALRADRHAS